MKTLILIMFAGAAIAQVSFINDAIGDFSIRLLKTTAKSDENNIVFSAYSITTALGMCLLGSKGETFVAMKAALGLEAVNTTDIEDGFSDSITELTPFAQPENKLKGFVLSAADRLYVSQSYPLSGSYRRKMKNIFHADAVSVDFANNASGVQDEINLFVSNKTRKLIPELLGKPLPGTTRMTLINALYFNGTWEDKMKQRPAAGLFNSYPNGTNQKAEWIGITKSLRYGAFRTLKAQFVEVPYISRANSPVRTSMVFILPDESYSSRVNEWIASKNFTWSKISAAIHSMKPEIVELTFPKFQLESTFKLRRTLTSLGMGMAFTARANFTSMMNGTAPNLFLDEVFHKAKMDVDENGTEAAAATAVMVMFMSMPVRVIPTVKLRIDRSFVALVIMRQEESIVPLFTSVVNTL